VLNDVELESELDELYELELFELFELLELLELLELDLDLDFEDIFFS